LLLLLADGHGCLLCFFCKYIINHKVFSSATVPKTSCTSSVCSLLRSNYLLHH
jgi:hypothetical protein